MTFSTSLRSCRQTAVGICSQLRSGVVYRFRSGISWINHAKMGLYCVKPKQNKPVLALLIHDIPQQIHCWIPFNNDKMKLLHSYSNILKRQDEAWVITNEQTLCTCTNCIRELLKKKSPTLHGNYLSHFRLIAPPQTADLLAPNYWYLYWWQPHVIRD